MLLGIMVEDNESDLGKVYAPLTPQICASLTSQKPS